MNLNSVPKVFVITLNWNGREWLDDCLQSILAMDYLNFSVVMVDNGSSDDSVAFVCEKFPSVHIIENGSNLGYARGFNVGLEYAYKHGADYFLIMNNDTVIDVHALTALVEAIQSCYHAGFVTGKVYFHDWADVFQTVGKHEDPVMWNGSHIGSGEKDIGQYDEVAERIFLDDVFTLVSRELYEEVGGYDSQFFLQGEEYDWQARAKKQSWRFYYTPKAKLWHKGSMSMGGLGSPTSVYFMNRNRILVMARHSGIVRFLRFYTYIAWSVSYSLLKGLIGKPFRGSIRLKSRIAGFLGLCAGTVWLIHRMPAQKVPTLIRKLH